MRKYRDFANNLPQRGTCPIRITRKVLFQLIDHLVELGVQPGGEVYDSGSRFDRLSRQAAKFSFRRSQALGQGRRGLEQPGGNGCGHIAYLLAQLADTRRVVDELWPLGILVIHPLLNCSHALGRQQACLNGHQQARFEDVLAHGYAVVADRVAAVLVAATAIGAIFVLATDDYQAAATEAAFHQPGEREPGTPAGRVAR